jgi:hypothetical protein
MYDSTEYIHLIASLVSPVKVDRIVETCTSLGLETRLLTLPKQHPALIPRISLAHVHSPLLYRYLVHTLHVCLRFCTSCLTHPSIHPSIIPWSPLVRSHAIPFYLT